MSEESFSGPLLVVGASRSGTTYLGRVAGGVPGVRLAYESDTLQEAYELFKKSDILENREVFENYLNRLRRIDGRSGNSNHLSLQSEAFYDRMYEEFRSHRDFARFMSDMFRAGREECEIWGDKCGVDQITTFFEVYPDTRVLFIVRDPRAVVSSFLEHSGVNHRTSSVAWVNTTRLAASLVRERPGQVLIVQYEELVQDIQAVFPGIASLLDRPVPDPIELIEEPSTASLEKWRTRLTHGQIRQIEEICFDEMVDLGYEPERALKKKNVGRVVFAFMMAQHGFALLRSGRTSLSGLLNFSRVAKYIRYYHGWDRSHASGAASVSDSERRR